MIRLRKKINFIFLIKDINFFKHKENINFSVDIYLDISRPARRPVLVHFAQLKSLDRLFFLPYLIIII